jgi:hypothetical protein
VPPREIVDEGTPAILEYLNNQAWWHLQRIFAGAAAFVAIVGGIVGTLVWRNRLRHDKKKRKDFA